MASSSGSSSSPPYPVFGEMDVKCTPGGITKMPVYKMTLENVKYSYVVFDNLGVLKKDNDPPFFVGMITKDELPVVDYYQVAEAFKNSKNISCNANVNNFSYQKEKVKLYGSAKSAKSKKDDDAFLLVTSKIACQPHSLSDPDETRKCSHYMMTEVFEVNEVKIMKEFKLDHLLNVAGILPLLVPDLGCISSVGFLVSEKGHVLGFHRENNKYCSVNLLLTGRKRWTFICPSANVNFRICCCHLVQKCKSLPAYLKNCQDPSQHKQFAVMFGDDRTSEARFEIEQLPGQVVFIPSNVYHQVEVIESSVAIAFNTIDNEWTKQNIEEFYGHCTAHDSIINMKNVVRQRAAYHTMQHYATHATKEFLSSINFKEHDDSINALTEVMREEAIKQDLEVQSQNKSSTSQKKTTRKTTHFQSEGDSSSAPSTDSLQNAISTGDHSQNAVSPLKKEDASFTPPLFDRQLGVREAGLVMVEVEAKFKCDVCPMLFTTAQEARYHCKQENFMCKFCQRLIGNEYNKSTHEAKCKQNPDIIKENERKEFEAREFRDAEFKKRFNGDMLPPESERARAKVNCIHCGKFFAYGNNGAGIIKHEKYCTANREHAIRKRIRPLGRPKGSKTRKMKESRDQSGDLSSEEEEPADE